MSTLTTRSVAGTAKRSLQLLVASEQRFTGRKADFGSSSIARDAGDRVRHAVRLRGPVHLAGRGFRGDHVGHSAAHRAEPQELQGEGPELRDRRGNGYGPVASLSGSLLRLRAAFPDFRRRGGVSLSLGRRVQPAHRERARPVRVRRSDYLCLDTGCGSRLRLEEGGPEVGVMQKFNEPNIITTSSDKLFNWARKNSLWPLQFGLACCAIEMMSTGMAHNDLDRFGAGFFTASPRQADVMIVSGTVSTKMAERMTRLYEQMPEPKWVIAMGACAISGGPFLDGYSVLMGADRVIPVDVYVPGCPPRPEALIFGVMTLQKKIEREQQVGGHERPRPALVDEDGNFLEYLPEREYSNISEGKAPRPEDIGRLKRTHIFERKGMPPAAMTDPGWTRRDPSDPQEDGVAEEPADPKGTA